jgi:hypothetical protein
MATRRFNKFSGLFLFLLTLIIALVGLLQTPQVLLANGIPQRWEANQYQPPTGLGAPRRTTGAGTRGPEASCPVVGKPLTALLPSNRFGVQLQQIQPSLSTCQLSHLRLRLCQSSFC